jgi:hypothetical protein
MMKRFFRATLLIIVAILFLLGAGWYGYTHRPAPESIHQVLFEGVTYTRDVRSEPRPLVIHVIAVDLSAPEVEFLVTPGDPDRNQPLLARKTSRFLDEFGLQVAVNGDFFTPWHSNSPIDYEPHAGDPVDVWGFASSRGVIYSQAEKTGATLYISEDNRPSFREPIGEVFNAISGNPMILEEGEVAIDLQAHAYHSTLHPRTVVALDADATRLIILLVDGRQPNYSEGVTMAELAGILREYGAYSALNLDGGGSTTLAIEGESGEPVLLNSPIDNRIPGRERPVANHLGIFAHRIDSAAENRAGD